MPVRPGRHGNISTEDLVHAVEREGITTGIDLDGLIGVAEWLGRRLGTPLDGQLHRTGRFPAAGRPAVVQRYETAPDAETLIRHASHELRTPLNCILGYGQRLQTDELPRHAGESVDRIVRAGRHLLLLINEVLDLTRVDADAPVLPVNPGGPLAEALDLLAPLAGERDIEILLDDDDGTERFVVADHNRLRQVLLNVLTNALKYNRPGGIVHVSLRTVGGGPAAVPHRGHRPRHPS